jgi:hypothetical protein
VKNEFGRHDAAEFPFAGILSRPVTGLQSRSAKPRFQAGSLPVLKARHPLHRLFVKYLPPKQNKKILLKLPLGAERRRCSFSD